MRRPFAGRRLREILVCAARAVEAELMAQRLDDLTARLAAAGMAQAQWLERLRQDLVQTHAAGRLRLERAGRLLAREKTSEAQDLLRSALEAAETFHAQATQWRALAEDTPGLPTLFDLGGWLSQLLVLLRTEASVRRAEIVTHGVPALTIHADAAALARRLLQAVLASLEQAGAGGVVHLQLEVLGDEARLVLRPEPAAWRRSGAPGLHVVAVGRVVDGVQ